MQLFGSWSRKNLTYCNAVYCSACHPSLGKSYHATVFHCYELAVMKSTEHLAAGKHLRNWWWWCMQDRKTLREQFPDANHQAVDLLKCLLKFDPRKRISANEALQHPWLALLHEEKKEPSAPGGADDWMVSISCIWALFEHCELLILFYCSLISNTHPAALNSKAILSSQMLVWFPTPFVYSHSLEISFPCCWPVTFEFDFEENSLSTEEIRSVVVKEIQLLKARNLARCRRMVCKE